MYIKNKIINFKELSSLKKKHKKKKIVLAHGTYDFFHYGHLVHLKKSKNYGDILVVSITADNFIKKGINRPIYNQNQRAQFLASINFIDYVVIINSLSGVEVIKELKPNIYCKGIEYKINSQDYTKKISKEIKELKKNNGKIIYTNETVLSSSNIINKFKLISDDKVNVFQKRIRKKVKFIDFQKKINNLINKKVLVIGDAIIDEYVFTSALSKSPKEEIISVKEESKTIYPGGIFATANNISNFVKNATLISTLEKNNNLFKKIKNRLNKNLKCIFFRDKNVNLSVKTRYLDAANKKLFQTNKLNFHTLQTKTEKKIINYLKKNIKKFDLIVVNDFGHGVLTKNIISLLQNYSKKLAVNVQTNSANFGYNFFDKYKKCYYLSLDEPEARFAIRDRKSESKTLIKKILRRTKSQIISITYGANGTKVFSQKKIIDLPALSKNVVDSLGAGDAFFAITSLYTLQDKDPENIGFIGNLVGALKIQYLAHEKYIDRQSFLGYLKSFLA
tara:strand:- start:2368 stop:3882 length:1515 start_codon:yes stop_codon:yes gene_type:complete